MFPEIRHIDDVRPHLTDEFVVKDGGWYKAVDYRLERDGTFDCPVRRELRGLKFDRQGYALARPYHKFHNLGERPETKGRALDWRQPHVILEKLDGSLVHPVVVDGEVRLMTRMGYTGVAQAAERHLPSVREFCTSMLSRGYTPMFEWVSPENRIVLRYAHDRLVLTGMRHTLSGAYIKHADVQSIAAPYGIAVARAWGANVADLDEFLEHARSLEDEEGYVVRFDDGTMVKVKADAYVRAHKAKDDIALEKNVLDLVVRGQEDDVIPLLPVNEACRLSNHASKVRGELAATANRIVDAVNSAAEAGYDRKTFALNVVSGMPEAMKGPAFRVWQGGDAQAAVEEAVLKNLSSRTKVDRIRPLIGGVVW